jgi:hypothetical protein
MPVIRLARPLVFAAVVVGASAAVGCGAHHAHGAQPDDAGPDEAGIGSPPLEASTQEGGNVVHDAAVDDAAPSTCAPGADLVYVASEERQIYSFDPTKTSFTLLGSIDCANGGYVNSMAIDRNATAWINYADGSLWKATTRNPTCTSTGFLPNQQGVGLFGMGFSAKTPGSMEDTLFIDDLSGGGLGFIDLSTMTLQRLGPFLGSLAGNDCELTGTANADLFGFFAGSPLGDAGTAAVAALDPNTEGATQQWALPGIDTGSDWAFAYWGGDFYLFTADKYNMTDPFTTVTRFRPSDGSLTMMAQNIGFRVVGAGSSTCAPTQSSQ